MLGAFLQVLGADEAGPEDNFFDLGGDSLRALRVIVELRTRFSVEIPLMRFFEAPTAAALAKLVSELQDPTEDGHSPAADPVDALDLAPLSYGQEQLWLAHQMNPSGAVYNVPFTIPLKRSIAVEHLRRALKEVLSRHAVLRSTFTLHGNRLVQIPADGADVDLEVEDLSNLSPQDRMAAAQATVEAQATRPFDLDNGPVLRACLIRSALEERSIPRRG